ncbi:GNAT family N-acetyltransferase [Cellulomonas biazotea]|uniref:N-acetyltransferase n=1 Tax=Cellulomonas biazotea TaxID=1709 RepID=A0A402DQU2_9CELL|nr:GNAT family N-acetyltransferase [Cellulomonas biazotea]GCE76468.1 N-acetyltransferase [Cellulomonas biazotea]
MLIHRVLEDDWELVRDVRLRALREDPGVFGSSLEREESFRESHWRMRLRGGPTWVAVDDERVPRGIVTMILEPGSPVDDRHVVSLWVAPESRRQGVGWALLDAVQAAAEAEGARTVSLWIVDGNHAAGDLYVRAGFTRTGERQPLPRDPSRVEERWVRPVGDVDLR